MDCPVCCKTMVIVELDSVEVDYCLSCRGVWLDGGELEILLDGAQGRDTLLNSLCEASPVQEKTRACPVCRKKMVKVAAGGQGEVVLDKCPGNDGLWLDADELQKVVHLASLGQDARVANLLQHMFSGTQT